MCNSFPEEAGRLSLAACTGTVPEEAGRLSLAACTGTLQCATAFLGKLAGYH